MRRALLASLTGLLLLAGACGGDGGEGDGEGTGGGTGQVQLAGGDVGTAVLPGLGDGAEAVDLAALRGSPVVVNFWASTCPPCVREMPALEAVHRAAGDDVAFVGVAVQDRVDAALELAAETGVTYALAADPRGELFTGAGAVLLPTTLVLDADGEVVRRLSGEITVAELTDVLAEETGTRVVVA
jgi:thiol-disulfide isomerase/thioredoxin